MCYWIYFIRVLLRLGRIRVSHIFKGALFIVIKHESILRTLLTKQSNLRDACVILREWILPWFYGIKAYQCVASVVTLYRCSRFSKEIKKGS